MEQKELYARGAEGIFAWDSNSRVCNLQVWPVVSRIGHREDLDALNNLPNQAMRTERILSIEGRDTTWCEARWRG